MIWLQLWDKNCKWSYLETSSEGRGAFLVNFLWCSRHNNPIQSVLMHFLRNRPFYFIFLIFFRDISFLRSASWKGWRALKQKKNGALLWSCPVTECRYNAYISGEKSRRLSFELLIYMTNSSGSLSHFLSPCNWKMQSIFWENATWLVLVIYKYNLTLSFE